MRFTGKSKLAEIFFLQSAPVLCRHLLQAQISTLGNSKTFTLYPTAGGRYGD